MEFDSLEQMMGVFGNFDENINLVARESGASFSLSNHGVTFSGEEASAKLAFDVVETLKKTI